MWRMGFGLSSVKLVEHISSLRQRDAEGNGLTETGTIHQVPGIARRANRDHNHQSSMMQFEDRSRIGHDEI